MNKYKTSSYNNDIGVVECVSETAMMCTIAYNWNGQRHERKVKKKSDYDRYHDTWADAHAYLLTRAQLTNERAATALDDAQRDLNVVKAMKEPK